MKFIVFDTETSGLPTLTFKPNIVQFCYVIFDTEIKSIEKEINVLIKQPKGYVISQESINIHKITNEMCNEMGVDLREVLDEFLEDTKKCSYIVGHNVIFDANMLVYAYNLLISECNSIEPIDVNLITQYLRKIKYVENFIVPKLYCTMKQSVTLCNIKRVNKRGYNYLKFPKLCELHKKLFDTEPEGLHNALVDVYACLRCYYMLIYNQDLLNINPDMFTY